MSPVEQLADTLHQKTLEIKTKHEDESLRQESKIDGTSTLIFSKPKPKGGKYYIHVLGDSISQGLLPGLQNEFIMDILNGKNARFPWPIFMATVLKRSGVSVSLQNHSESGRRIAGATDLEGGRACIGEKDGRIALQGIVSQIINKHSELNENVIIMINLGTNDLHDIGITPEYLKGSLIKNVITILTDPNLQFKLLKKLNPDEFTIVLDFMKTLNKFVSDDIRKNFSATPSDKASDLPKIPTHSEQFKEMISEKNRAFIQKLFNMIGWKIILVPTVEVIGYPYGKETFPSAELSKQWNKIIKETVEFFGVPNIFAVDDAEKFVIPHIDEFGGCVHLNEEDNINYAHKMAEFLLSSPKVKMVDEFGRSVAATPPLGALAALARSC